MEKIKEIWEKIYDKIYKATRRFEGINELIFEKTGIKIDVGMILFAIVFVLLIAFFVRIILGLVWHALMTGDY